MNDSDVFDSKLLQRLTRPLVQPGVINAGMARDIILRSQIFANRLPLMAIAQRHGNITESQTEQIPIVYAQRLLPKTEIVSDVSHQANAKAKNPQGEGSKITVIQAKFASPTSRNSLTVNPEQKSVIPENSTNSLPLVNLLPPNSPGNRVAAESVPTVYPQPLSPETRVSDISLQAHRQTPQAEENKTRVSQFDKNLDDTLTPPFHKGGWEGENFSEKQVSLPTQDAPNQTTVIQAKLASPTPRNSLKINSQPESVIPQPQNQTNSLPLVNLLPPNSPLNQPNPGAESLPIVYPQPLSPETRLSDIYLQTNRQNIQDEASNPEPQPPNSTNSLPIASPFLANSPQNSLESASIHIGYAKSIKIPPNYMAEQGNLLSGEILIIYPKSRHDERENKPGASHFGKDTHFLPPFSPPQPPLSKGGERIQPVFLLNRDAPNKPTAKAMASQTTIKPPIQPPPLPKLIVREINMNSAKVNTPLVFAHPSVTPSQAALEMPNRGRESVSSREINPEIAPVTSQSYPIPQIQVKPYQEASAQIDIDTLAAKVERKLMRKLIVENERRGGKL
ncbi:hypothetical protein [Limnofasciculus baicalensis]|uniref:Uncharacterized protein n=1 Tax=Limnofasciculus baicalensis BBK-W-15 TaxID=2699891 RepID=A0AAE3KMV0_9CYAN|nr:hypothetical protein [Limnofasciculus baicalensis]MCP2729166.1 hypothetical protein [Limnofasciculus baicalensis BBK-W-15]